MKFQILALLLVLSLVGCASDSSPTGNEEPVVSSGTSLQSQEQQASSGGLSSQANPISGTASESSSSVQVLVSSSSAFPVAPQAADWCAADPANCGTILDTRDNRTYKWTKIGSQTWLAENLKYTGAETGTRVGWCPGQHGADSTADHATCESIGRLYSWYELNKSSYASSADPQGLCPAGWHVMSHDEWIRMMTYLRTANNLGSIGNIGHLLKATNTGNNLWDNTEFNAGNPYQFSALPSFESNGVMYWTNDEQGTSYGWGQTISAYSSETMSNLLNTKNVGAYARCILGS